MGSVHPELAVQAVRGNPPPAGIVRPQGEEKRPALDARIRFAHNDRGSELQLVALGDRRRGHGLLPGWYHPRLQAQAGAALSSPSAGRRESEPAREQASGPAGRTGATSQAANG